MKTWLQSYNDPTFIDSYWEKTFQMRKNEFSKTKKNLFQLFVEWPKFTTANGPEFIRKDFYFLNMNYFNNLIDGFDSFSNKILKHAFQICRQKKSMFNPTTERNLSMYQYTFVFVLLFRD